MHVVKDLRFIYVVKNNMVLLNPL